LINDFLQDGQCLASEYKHLLGESDKAGNVCWAGIGRGGVGGGGGADANRGGIVGSVLELAEYLTAGDNRQVYDMADRDGSGDCGDLDGEGSQGGRVNEADNNDYESNGKDEDNRGKGCGGMPERGESCGYLSSSYTIADSPCVVSSWHTGPLGR
jgi:hypothetical protein